MKVQKAIIEKLKNNAELQKILALEQKSHLDFKSAEEIIEFLASQQQRDKQDPEKTQPPELGLRNGIFDPINFDLDSPLPFGGLQIENGWNLDSFDLNFGEFDLDLNDFRQKNQNYDDSSQILDFNKIDLLNTIDVSRKNQLDPEISEDIKNGVQQKSKEKFLEQLKEQEISKNLIDNLSENLTDKLKNLNLNSSDQVDYLNGSKTHSRGPGKDLTVNHKNFNSDLSKIFGDPSIKNGKICCGFAPNFKLINPDLEVCDIY